MSETYGSEDRPDVVYNLASDDDDDEEFVDTDGEESDDNDYGWEDGDSDYSYGDSEDDSSGTDEPDMVEEDDESKYDVPDGELPPALSEDAQVVEENEDPPAPKRKRGRKKSKKVAKKVAKKEPDTSVVAASGSEVASSGEFTDSQNEEYSSLVASISSFREKVASRQYMDIWRLGKLVDSIKHTAKYGNRDVAQLAVDTGIDSSTLYRARRIAEAFSKEDMLSFAKCASITLSAVAQLASVKDNEARVELSAAVVSGDLTVRDLQTVVTDQTRSRAVDSKTGESKGSKATGSGKAAGKKKGGSSSVSTDPEVIKARSVVKKYSSYISYLIEHASEFTIAVNVLGEKDKSLQSDSMMTECAGTCSQLIPVIGGVEEVLRDVVGETSS